MIKKMILSIIIVIVLIGIIGAGVVSLEIVKFDFTEKILTISTEKICGVELLSTVLERKCSKDTQKEIIVNENMISITKNPKTDVIMIQNK